MEKTQEGSQNRPDDRQKFLEYQKRISNILESFTDGFFEVDARWKITYWNREAERLLSRPRARALGQNLWDLYPEAVSLQFYPQYHKAVADNVSVRFEEYLPTSELWLEVAAFPSGEGLSVYFKDITPRKNVHRELEMERQKYRDLFNRSPLPQWVYEVQSKKFLDVNEAAVDLYGYSKSDFLAMTLLDIRPLEDIPKLTELLTTLAHSGGNNNSCVRHLKKNGDLINVNVAGKSIEFEQKDARLVMVIDRTMEMSAIRAMEESIERFNIVSKATSDAIWDWNMQTGTISWNKGIKGIYGYEGTTYDQHWWKSKIHPDDLDQVVQKIQSGLQHRRKRLSLEYRFENADGTYRFVLDRTFIMFNNTGQPSRMIGSMQDITEKVNYIQDIEAHISKLEEISWIQAHKVRGPLSNILGLVGVLTENCNPDSEFSESLGHLKRAAEQLDGVLREILTKV